GEGRIRAVIVGGEPFSDDPDTECFPEALRFKFDDVGEMTGEHAEPIAADLRKGGDGKKYAISKLVAGLTGAKLDDLIQREQARRNQRMRAMAAGFGAVAVAMGALAFDAMRQRDVARVADAEAVKARDDALVARSEAEDEIEFMLTDLRKKLDAVGRLDILDTVGERALGYYAKRDLSSASPDELGRRARAQLLVGEVDNLRGDLDAALEAYTAAANTTEEQLRRDPDNPDRIFDHSQSVFWVGYIAWQRGDANTARRYWTQYYDQAKRLIEIDPGNDDFQAELEYSYSNLGTLEMDQGNAAEAEEWFRKSLGVSKALAEKYPGAVNRQIAAGQSYSWLAEALYHQAKIREAREARESELAIYEAVQAGTETDATLGNNESIARYSYADILLSEGRIDRAIDEAQLASALADRLFNADPKNLHLADRAVLARSILGEALTHTGDYVNASSNLTTAVTIADRLIAEDPTNLRWRGKVAALPELQLAILAERQDRLEEAAEKIDPLLLRLRPLVEEGASDVAVLRIYLTSLACQARINDDFTDNWATIVSFLAGDIQKHGPKTLTLAIEAHAQMGQHELASDLSQSLHKPGFRHPEFIRLFDDHPFLIPDTE
ncbi:MAG: tetratricopeptide repeat protein, partial [Marinicaulis sp.]|nr:tetratricopeptide repeat protein [Marinicaulis sp.]